MADVKKSGLVPGKRWVWGGKRARRKRARRGRRLTRAHQRGPRKRLAILNLAPRMGACPGREAPGTCLPACVCVCAWVCAHAQHVLFLRLKGVRFRWRFMVFYWGGRQPCGGLL
jgi:hypothetical protein